MRVFNFSDVQCNFNTKKKTAEGKLLRCGEGRDWPPQGLAKSNPIHYGLDSHNVIVV